MNLLGNNSWTIKEKVKHQASWRVKTEVYRLRRTNVMWYHFCEGPRAVSIESEGRGCWE
jgi:hypothetical protein